MKIYSTIFFFNIAIDFLFSGNCLRRFAKSVWTSKMDQERADCVIVARDFESSLESLTHGDSRRDSAVTI